MPISPADYVIGKLGGLTAAAGKIKTAKWPDGIPVTTVQGWKTRERIPQDHWALCIEAAKAENITLTLSDFIEKHEDEGEAAEHRASKEAEKAA